MPLPPRSFFRRFHIFDLLRWSEGPGPGFSTGRAVFISYLISPAQPSFTHVRVPQGGLFTGPPPLAMPPSASVTRPGPSWQPARSSVSLSLGRCEVWTWPPEPASLSRGLLPHGGPGSGRSLCWAWAAAAGGSRSRPAARAPLGWPRWPGSSRWAPRARCRGLGLVFFPSNVCFIFPKFNCFHLGIFFK